VKIALSPLYIDSDTRNVAVPFADKNPKNVELQVEQGFFKKAR